MALLGFPNTRDHIPALMERGVRDTIFNQYDNMDNQYQELFPVLTSQKRQETDVILSGLGQFVLKAEGNSPTFDAGQQAWTKVFTHNTWALGLEITEEGMEDDLYGFYAAMGKELGIAASYTQEVQSMDLFNDFSATVYTAEATNYAILSTAHYRVDGGTWSNRPSTAVDLGLESLEAALSAWRTNMVDQRGRKIVVRPEILLVGPTDEWMAARLLESDGRPFTADNDPNVVKMRRKLRVVVSDFMTDDGRWFLLGAKGKTGLRYNQRVGLQVKRRDDTRTGNMLMVARYRESHGTPHVTGIYGSP